MVICSGVSLRSEPGLFPVIRNNKGQLPKERPLFKEGYFEKAPNNAWPRVKSILLSVI